MARKRYPKRVHARSKIFSYKDSSSESESDVATEPEDILIQEARAPKRPRLAQSRAKQIKPKPRPTPPKYPASKIAAVEPKLLSDGIIPPWVTLPYEIWVQIFKYASFPLHDDAYRPMESMSWLVKAIRICKNLAEPAISALYFSPPLLSIDKPHLLLEILQSNPKDFTFNYLAKIRSLDLDLDRTLSRMTAGKGRFDLTALVKILPKLTRIDISRPINRPPYRSMMHKAARWYYPESLFEAFRESECRLQSWRFDEDLLLLDKSKSGPAREEVIFEELNNPSSGFRYLRHLTISRFQRLFTPQRQQDLQDCLLHLKELRSLEFESCVCDAWKILEVMPANLSHLNFVNCSTLTSEDLQAYLVSYGMGLRSMTLNHNRALNLSFLENFNETCPRLEIFRVDCNYFSNLENRVSTDPGYEQILEEDQIPTWPRSLQVIEMLHLRRWTSKTAETFFGSLVDSAPALSSLRRLILKIILDIGWRDRAGFREDGIGELRQVFLRRAVPPNPNLSTLRAFRIWNLGRDTDRSLDVGNSSDNGPKEDNSSQLTSNNSPGTSKSRKSKRILQQEIERASSSLREATDQKPGLAIRNKKDHSQMIENESNNNNGDKNLFIQGMCNVVDISIDNLRLREVQFHESDFMDSEVSGDEDWTADRERPEASGYAW